MKIWYNRGNNTWVDGYIDQIWHDKTEFGGRPASLSCRLYCLKREIMMKPSAFPATVEIYLRGHHCVMKIVSISKTQFWSNQTGHKYISTKPSYHEHDAPKHEKGMDREITTRWHEVFQFRVSVPTLIKGRNKA